MITLILTIHIILACCIICAVLLQKSEGGGLGIGGSGGSGGAGGAGGAIGPNEVLVFKVELLSVVAADS